MATKRQKKKQQKKQLQQTAQRAGIPERQARKQSLKELEAATKKQRQKDRRRQREKEKYNDLLSRGVPAKDARKMRGWSKDRIEKEIKKRERQRRPKRLEKINVYWRDVVEVTDMSLPSILRREAKRMTIRDLIGEIKVWLYTQGGEIGTYQIHMLADTRGLDMFMDDFAKVYGGQAGTYRPVIETIYMMTQLLYESMDKFMFVKEFQQHVAFLNPAMAQRLERDIL